MIQTVKDLSLVCLDTLTIVTAASMIASGTNGINRRGVLNKKNIHEKNNIQIA